MATGCYTPLYAPASFKGVPFDALETGSEHGRRVAEGEFPFSEITATADMGRRIRRYPVSARLAENSHIADTALLIAACETPGPGMLIHPTRGAVMVMCTQCSVRDNPLEEQGVTYVELEFVEANIFSSGFQLGSAIFGLVLTPLLNALQSGFKQTYKPMSVHYLDKNEVVATGAEALQQLRAEYQAAITGTTDQSKWLLLSEINTASLDSTVLEDADNLFTAIKNSFAALAGEISGQPAYDAFRRMANWSAKVSGLDGTAASSQDAVYGLVRAIAAGYMARTSFELPVRTLGEALDQADAISGMLEQEMLLARNNCQIDSYNALRDYEQKVKAALMARAYNLPALVQYNFSTSVPSLVAAYEIFNDAKRFGEIELRNPGGLPFMVGPLVIASGAA